MNGPLYQCAWLGYRGNISLKPSWNLTIEQLSPRSGEEVVGTRVSHSSFTCDFRLVTSTLKTVSPFLWCAHVTYIIAKHCSPRVWQDESSCEMYKNQKGSCKAWKLLLLNMQICDLPVLVVIGHFGKYHNTLCLSPQILLKHCFQFLLGLPMVPRENKNNAHAKFGGNKQRVLWYFPKRPIYVVS